MDFGVRRPAVCRGLHAQKLFASEAALRHYSELVDMLGASGVLQGDGVRWARPRGSLPLDGRRDDLRRVERDPARDHLRAATGFPKSRPAA